MTITRERLLDLLTSAASIGFAADSAQTRGDLQRAVELSMREQIDAAVPARGPEQRIYLDLTTASLPEQEMRQIGGCPVRVIEHEYGVWVHVPPIEADADPLDSEIEDWPLYPHLRRLLVRAREMGAAWINFDRDSGEAFANLPTFDW